MGDIEAAGPFRQGSRCKDIHVVLGMEGDGGEACAGQRERSGQMGKRGLVSNQGLHLKGKSHGEE